MHTHTNPSASGTLRAGALTLILLIGGLLAACTGRADRYDELLSWQGPIVLDRHVYYLEPMSGELVVVDPRDGEGSWVYSSMPDMGVEKPDWRYLFTFPDRRHLLFVSQKAGAYVVLDDEDASARWTFDDLPLAFDTFAFSPDGRWMAGYKVGVSVYENYSDYYSDEDDVPLLFGLASIESSPLAITVRAPGYDFTGDRPILADSHALLLVDLESGEETRPSLGRNDVPIESVFFTGRFAICTHAFACSGSEAEETERIVAAGPSRLWLLDPEKGNEPRVDVVPLAAFGAAHVLAGVTFSANLADSTDRSDGFDTAEALFLPVQSSPDVVMLNMLWDQETARLSYSINKLALPFSPRDLRVYVDGGALHLFALAGDDRAAFVRVDSAQATPLTLPHRASRTLPIALGDGTDRLLLYGEDSLMIVSLAHLDPLGAKNVTSAPLSFTAPTIWLTENESPRVVALSDAERRLAVVDVEALAQENLSAIVRELTKDVEAYLFDPRRNQLVLLGYSSWDEEAEAEAQDVFFVPLDKQGEETRLRVDPAEELFIMHGTDAEDDRVLLSDTRGEGRLTVTDVRGESASTLGGFLFGRELF